MYVIAARRTRARAGDAGFAIHNSEVPPRVARAHVRHPVLSHWDTCRLKDYPSYGSQSNP